MKKVTYTTAGTCSRLIDIEYDPDTMTLGRVAFTGGCNGNLKGICSLVEGQPVDRVIQRLRGIQCGSKGTSCPDQLARALQAISQQSAES